MSQLFVTTLSTRLGSKAGLLKALGLTLIVMVASVGCRSTADNQIDLLERELRTQEDYIYELESYVVEYSEKLRDTRYDYPQQTAGYAEEVQTPEPARTQSKKRGPRRSDDELLLETQEGGLPTPDKTRRSPEIVPYEGNDESNDETYDEATADEISPEEMEVPDEIEFEIEEPLSELDSNHSLRQVATVALDIESRHEGALFIPDPVDYLDIATDHRSVAAIADRAGHIAEAVSMADVPRAEQLMDDQPMEETAALDDRKADHLEVTQLFQNEGDAQQSLLTVVEALDANGEPVDLDGEISVMVMTADEATPQRLKRWNFTSDETVAAWQSTDLGDGVHLELPLEKLRLPATALELWVRLVMDDGRKLLTQLPFHPNQLGHISTEATEAELANAPAATSQLPADADSQRRAENNDLRIAKQETPTNQPRWRASMQRSDRAASRFAATSPQKQGWTTQAIARQRRNPVEVASRHLPAAPHQSAAERLGQSLWNSADTVVPAASTTRQLPSGNTPATWSTSH